MNLDLAGAQGGLIASAFGAGWVACMALMVVIGRILGKAKDDQIATLIGRIEHLEKDAITERARCDRHIEELNTRIRVLEAMTLGSVRQQTQKVISEQRVEGHFDEH